MTIFIVFIANIVTTHPFQCMTLHLFSIFAATRVIKFVINGKLSRNSPSYEVINI